MASDELRLERFYASINERLNELSRLKPLQDEVSALHEELRHLRHDLKNHLPERHQERPSLLHTAQDRHQERPSLPLNCISELDKDHAPMRAGKFRRQVSPYTGSLDSGGEEFSFRHEESHRRRISNRLHRISERAESREPKEVNVVPESGTPFKSKRELHALGEERSPVGEEWAVKPILDTEVTMPHPSPAACFALGDEGIASLQRAYGDAENLSAHFDVDVGLHRSPVEDLDGFMETVSNNTTTVDLPQSDKHEFRTLVSERKSVESEAIVVDDANFAYIRSHDTPIKVGSSGIKTSRSTQLFSSTPINDATLAEALEGVAAPRRIRCRLYQLHPDSFSRSIWDLASCFALVFDSIMIPIVLAFSPVTTGFIMLAMFFTAAFWTIDIFATLNTSYFTRDGDLETSRLKIFRRYVKRTLILDTFICTTDWLGIVADIGATNGESESNETWSLLRLVKINRIFRLILVQIIAIFVMIVWVNHILTCVWYAIGVHGSKDTGQSWLDAEVNSENPMPISYSSDFYKYTTAFHWSISQLTPGSMQVMPMNSLERIVNISYLLFGLLFCTSLISRMSALMVQLQMANQEQNKIVKLLRLFLRQKSVTATVAQRIERQIVSQLKTVRPLTMNDIPALSSLSKTLRIELKCDLYAQHLLPHPVLRCLLTSTFGGAVCREMKFACDALECVQLTTSEELFTKGEITRKSFLLVQGCLLYDAVDDEFHATHSVSWRDTHTTPQKVSATSTWVCPAALWTDWETRGYMEADTLCEVALLDGNKVLPVLSGQHPRLASLVKHYQRNYIKLLQDGNMENATDLEEVVDHALVVFYLPVANKLELCEPLLENLRQRTWFWGHTQEQALKDLEVEVAKGKSALISSSDGSPVRVAIVTALRVYRPHGEMFVQVADIKGPKFTCLCRLPATKLISDEVPSMSALRVLKEVQEYLGDVGSGISAPVPHSTDIEKSASLTYGILTQYNRTIFVAHQGASTISSPPRIQFEGVRRRFSNPGLPRLGSLGFDTQEDLTDSAIQDLIIQQMPWLEAHLAAHIHIQLTPGGKGSVYTWIYPDEYLVIQKMLQQD